MTTQNITDDAPMPAENQQQVDAILHELDEIHEKVTSDHIDINQKMTEIEQGVNQSCAVINKNCTELDAIEKEAGDEFDAFIIKQANDLVEEEKDDNAE